MEWLTSEGPIPGVPRWAMLAMVVLLLAVLRRLRAARQAAPPDGGIPAPVAHLKTYRTVGQRRKAA